MDVRPEIRAMAGYVPGEQPQHGKFIKLNTNENPYPCSPAVKRAIGHVCQAGLQRYPDPQATAFRNRAAELYGVEPDWILCGNGSDDILTILTRAYVGPGQKLRFPYPSYILYRTLAEIQGAASEEIRFTERWKLGDDFSAADDALRLAVIPNPNSPSGTLLAPDEVARLAEQLPCPLLVDEAYADFAKTNCIELVKDNPQVMVCRTLSKSYALAGLRFGFLIAQPAVIEQLNKVKDSYNCDALSIAGATAAIDDQAWLEENRRQILETRERLLGAVRALGFTPPDSEANFVWCPHPTLDVKPLYEGLKDSQILVRYMEYPDWGAGLRISVGSDAQVDACIARLTELVNEAS